MSGYYDCMFSNISSDHQSKATLEAIGTSVELILLGINVVLQEDVRGIIHLSSHVNLAPFSSTRKETLTLASMFSQSKHMIRPNPPNESELNAVILSPCA